MYNTCYSYSCKRNDIMSCNCSHVPLHHSRNKRKRKRKQKKRKIKSKKIDKRKIKSESSLSIP